MLKHLFSTDTFRRCSVILILPLFLCHTVIHANDNIGFQSRQDTLFPATERSLRFKREPVNPVNIDVISQTPSPTVAENNATAESVNKSLPHLIPTVENVKSNSTLSLPGWMNTIKSGALERTGFVALGFMSIVVIFFVVRGIRLRHKKSKSRKYGIITSTDMEMEPLDNDDDDEEDTTLFDAQHKYSLP